MKNFLEEFEWHSSLGFNLNNEEKTSISKLPNTKVARKMFISADDGSTLIHKTSQSLWRISEDGNSIEAVFDSDVLTEEDLQQLED